METTSAARFIAAGSLARPSKAAPSAPAKAESGTQAPKIATAPKPTHCHAGRAGSSDCPCAAGCSKGSRRLATTTKLTPDLLARDAERYLLAPSSHFEDDVVRDRPTEFLAGLLDGVNRGA